MKSKKVYSAKIVLALAVMALAGCAAGMHKDDSAAVGERAVQRWNLLIQHNAENAYDFLTPGYRATMTRDDYAKSMNHRPVAWKSVDLVDATCAEDACTVHVKLVYNVAINLHGRHEVKGDSPIEEHWIRESGHWYLLPDDKMKPRKPSQNSM